ncbi:SDR family oxidoreductase [Nocardia sp. NBC_01503]|uniref:SDR family NAD(P)-dependent oxidoreductase n=1 Tax=Nocardia sp. NBC_01503 TaxID=2975997 RepID=UPI002E7AB390|nr:SDR family oxidoreductase [Nocardia sp. NBC_01503]WTL35711.1 SDR family oxidoreductase [Nocardia sp. NBC_01503]
MSQIGKIALVTGASRGIGRAIALRLAGDGATVVVHYGRDDEAAGKTVAEIEAAGGRAFAIRADLGSPAGIDSLFAELVRRLPEGQLDILVNNAGGGGGNGSIEQLTPAAVDSLFAVNVSAPLFISQRAIPLLRDGGRIVNISSCAPRVAAPAQVAYAMSKGAIDVLTKTLAVQLGPRGITVNAVAAGATETEGMAAFLDGNPMVRASISAMTALGRVGQPADIADVVAFLASEQARWITANVVDVSGGTAISPAIGAR